MAMMMTGRVLLACALCVLWCGAASANGSDAAETHEDPSRGLQSAPQLGPAKQPEETKPIEGVSNTAEQSLDAQEVKNGNPPKGSVKQTPTQNGGMEENLKKGEGKKSEKDEKAEQELEGDQEQPLTRKDTTEDEKETTPALPENKEPPPPPPAGAATPPASDGNHPGDSSKLRNSASDGDIQPAADRMHSGGGAGSIRNGGGGKQSGQSGVSGGDHLPNPSSSSGSFPRPPTHDGKGAPQDPGEDSSPQNKKSLEKVVQSGASVDSALPKVDEVQKSEPDPQQIRPEALVTVGGTGNEARREAEGMNEASSGKQVTNEKEVLSPPAGGSAPDPNGTHNSPETNAVNSASENEPESNSLERPSGDGEAGQQDKEADTQGTQETEVTQGTAASPVSTSGSGGAQSEADADGDDPQRPNPEGP
ncbi:mucin-associated surface protein (MASP), partial [Trypanosoma cruzi]